jgi:hypothetical protein
MVSAKMSVIKTGFPTLTYTFIFDFNQTGFLTLTLTYVLIRPPNPCPYLCSCLSGLTKK